MMRAEFPRTFHPMEDFITLLADNFIGRFANFFSNGAVYLLNRIVPAVDVHQVRYGFKDIFELLLSLRHMLEQAHVLYGRCDLVSEALQDVHVVICDRLSRIEVVDPEDAYYLVPRYQR